MEYKVLVGETEYGMKDIESATIELPLFNEMSVGNACSAEMSIVLWPIAEIPRMAKIVPQARKSSDDEWEPLGTFYVDTRETLSNGKISLIAYDSMLKAESEWVPESADDFPMKMSDAVEIIAGLMGVSVDSRTSFPEEFYLDYPANGYTLRDVLGYIAAAYAGNWIITAENTLLLVPLFGSAPDSTNYLVTESGDAILFGGVRIVV